MSCTTILLYNMSINVAFIGNHKCVKAVMGLRHMVSSYPDQKGGV